MNSTTSQTTIVVNTVNAKAQSDASIKKVVIYDYRGRARVIEKVRGIQI